MHFFKKIKLFFLKLLVKNKELQKLDNTKKDIEPSEEKRGKNVGDDVVEKQEETEMVNNPIYTEAPVGAEVKDNNDDNIDVIIEKKETITEEDVLNDIKQLFGLDIMARNVETLAKQKQTQKNIEKIETMHAELTEIMKSKEISDFLNNLSNKIDEMVIDLFEKTK